MIITKDSNGTIVEEKVITEVRSFKSGHSLDKYSNINI